MSNFALNVNSSPQSIIQSLNYALATAATSSTSSNIAGNVLTANTSTGSISTTSGNIVSYIYQYMNVAYANSATGSGFNSNSAYANYYGVHNSNSSNPDLNPADYQWTQVSGGFGNTKQLYYNTIGGRAINFSIGSTSPGFYYQPVTNVAINLDSVTSSQTIYSATIYTAANSAPSIPTGGTYNFANLYLGAPTGWSANIPALGYYSTIYSSQNTFLSSQNNVNGPSKTWTTPAVVSGVTGLPAQVTYTFTCYTSSPIQPPTPTANTGSWNFSTTTGTPPRAMYDQNSNYQLYPNLQGNMVFRTDIVNYDTYYTFYPNTTVLSNTVTPGASFTVVNSEYGQIVANIFAVGSGGSGSPSYDLGAAYNYEFVSGGGSGGQVVLANNTILNSDTYTVDIGNYVVPETTASGVIFSLPTVGASTIIESQTSSNIIIQANGGAYGETNTLNIHGVMVASSGGWGDDGNIAPSSANIINGAHGVPDPWGTITWVGKYDSNYNRNVFSGGGGAAEYEWSTFPVPPAPPYTYGVGADGGGNANSANVNLLSDIESQILSPGTGSGGGATTYPSTYATHSGGPVGAQGVVIIRVPFGSAWSVQQPSVQANSAVWASSAYVTTNNANVTVSGLTWSTPVQITGNIGPRGIFSSAYVLTSSDPTDYTQIEYTTAFESPRSNIATPIGTGYSPITGDTATFTYAPTNASVTKTFYANIGQWIPSQQQFITGNLLIPNSVSSSDLISSDLYPLNIISQNGSFDNFETPGYWMDPNSGNVNLGGNVYIGNTTVIGSNVIIGANATLGNNISMGNIVSMGANISMGNNISMLSNISMGSNVNISNFLSNSMLTANTVTTLSITPGSVMANALAANSVTSSAIAANTLLPAMFTANSVTATSIAPGSVAQIYNLINNNPSFISGGPTPGTFYEVYGTTVSVPVKTGDTITALGTGPFSLEFANPLHAVDQYQMSIQISANDYNGNLIGSTSTSNQMFYWANTASSVTELSTILTTGAGYPFTIASNVVSPITISMQFSWANLSYGGNSKQMPTSAGTHGNTAMTVWQIPLVG